MEKQYSSLEVMAKDTGMPSENNSMIEYLQYLGENELINETDDEDTFFYIDKTNGKLVLFLENDILSEIHYCYETEIRKQVILTEFHKSHNLKDFGAMLIESTEGDYGLCAELDFYKKVKLPELPLKTEVKIYALALDVMFFKDKMEFDEVMKKNPLGISPSGNPIYIGSKFLSASGTIPESDAPFPSMAYMTAEILGLESRINEFTGKEFFILNCDGTIGEFELLCAPELASENMQAGGIINGRVIFRIEVVKILND